MWRNSLQCPTEEEYVYMVNNKTGGLLRLGVKLMMAWAATNVDTTRSLSRDYVPVINLIGVYYQMRDNLMNLQSPVVLSLDGLHRARRYFKRAVHDTSNLEILITSLPLQIDVLQKRISTSILKDHAIQYLKAQTKSFEYTLRARGEVERLVGIPGLEAILDALHVDGESLR
ncbi:hypothetical protein B0H11DRAFT_1938725 [Mycena galericulata]|nr:hypothetical protein B0H11DRAFT_1938725 [Mycena galericulata]